MVDLTAKSACAGLLPLSIGDATLEEVDAGPLTSLSPLDDADALPGALQDAHGLGWPGVGRSTAKEGARLLWFGRAEVMLMGVAPDKALGAHAAVVDQTDAWAAVRLSGSVAVDVLARLVPIDLRDAQFANDDCIRTQLFHLNVSITKLDRDAFMILVFRSMATTLVHDLKAAMQAVAARGRIAREEL